MTKRNRWARLRAGVTVDRVIASLTVLALGATVWMLVLVRDQLAAANEQLDIAENQLHATNEQLAQTFRLTAAVETLRIVREAKIICIDLYPEIDLPIIDPRESEIVELIGDMELENANDTYQALRSDTSDKCPEFGLATPDSIQIYLDFSHSDLPG